MAMSIQDAKEKIDGYHALAQLGIETLADTGDTVNGFLASIGQTNPAMVDELYDYVFESLKKFNLV